MAAFSSLSDKLNHIFSKLKNKGSLTELEIKQAMREVRIALIEADVNYSVIKKFVADVTEKAVGEEILKSLTPEQQVIKIVNEELIALMGSTHQQLTFSSNPPTVYMMCGLQGAGKTTMCGKLGAMLKKQGKKVLLVAGDIYRPAAIKQLGVVAERAGVGFFEKGTQSPVATAKEAVQFALSQGFDTVIIDTAGRLQIDTVLMQELKDIKAAVDPKEILLVVDSMTGQEAVNVATTFNADLDISGVIVTKLDGDTRGGAALSIRAVTGKPIKFAGTGEKLTDIEAFHPDRMASRILGMGDVLTLIEKAQNAFSEQEALDLQRKIKERSFTLDDYLDQLDKIKKMGSVSDILGMIPGANKINPDDLQVDEKKMAHIKAIILSMTKKERTYPENIKSSQKKRIANGSGTSIQEVNQLLKQFAQMKDMMKQMQSGQFGRMGGKFAKRFKF